MRQRRPDSHIYYIVSSCCSNAKNPLCKRLFLQPRSVLPQVAGDGKVEEVEDGRGGSPAAAAVAAAAVAAAASEAGRDL